VDGGQRRLRRLPFGYGRRSVDEYLRQQEALLRERERILHETQTKMAELQTEIQQRERALDRLTHEIDSIGVDPQESSHDYASRLTATLMTEELQKVLGAAQEAATRIIERADLSTQERLQEAEELWGEVESQLSTLTTWREVMSPLNESTQKTIDFAQAQIDDVPGRIREALLPMADAIADVQAQIAELARVASPPPVTKPELLDDAPGEAHDQEVGTPTADFHWGRAYEEDEEEESELGPADPSGGTAPVAQESPAPEEDPGIGEEFRPFRRSGVVAPEPHEVPEAPPSLLSSAEAAVEPIPSEPEAAARSTAPPVGEEASEAAESGAIETPGTRSGSPESASAVSDGSAADVVPLDTERAGRSSHTGRWVAAAAAILVLLAAAGLGGFLIANRAPSNESKFNDFIAETGTHLVAFTPSGGRQLSIAFRPGQSEAWIVGRNLPTPTHRQVYELWYFPTGSETPVAAGTFVPEDGDVLQQTTLGQPFSTLAVTIEPHGGSKQPTTNPIFVMKV
jgi:Anti-sigma-K factor rskA